MFCNMTLSCYCIEVKCIYCDITYIITTYTYKITRGSDLLVR